MNKNKVQRLEFVDMLRGLAMVVMVLLHTNAYFLNNPVSLFTWDWGQFAVPVFIFCSSYIFFKKQYSFSSLSEFFHYAKKRIVRLLIPYYIFVVVYGGLVYLQNSARLTLKYTLQNIMLVGGIDINWLVLLFVCFIFIMPFVQWSIEKNKKIFYMYFLFCLVLSVITIFNFPLLTSNYRLTMWLPWSLLIIANYFIVKYEKNFKILFGVFSISTIIFVALYFFQKYLGHSTIQYYNKYPPNLYHIAFGITSTIPVFLVAKRGLFSSSPLRQLLSFLSKHSYSLYFVHYCVIFVLFVFTKIKFNWITFFITVLFISIIIQLVINKIRQLKKPYLFSAL